MYWSIKKKTFSCVDILFYPNLSQILCVFKSVLVILVGLEGIFLENFGDGKQKV